MKGVKSVEFRFYILTLIILTTQGSTQRSFGAAKRNIVIKKNNELSLEVQSVQINSDLIKIGLNNKNFVTLNSPKPIRIICSKLSQNSVNTPGKISAFVNTQQAESLKCLEFHRDHLNEDAYCLKQEFRFNLPARGYSYYDVSCRIEGSEGAASVSTFLHRLYTDGIPRIRSSLSLDNLNSTVAHMINLERLSCESIKGSSKGEVALGFNALQWFIGGQGPSPGQDHSIGFNTISNQITEDLYIYKSPFPLHSKQITNNTIYKCCTILNGKIVECQQFLANIYSQPTKFTKSQKSSSTTISTSITSKSPPSSKFSTFSTQTTTKTTSKTTSAHKINSKSKNLPPLLNIPQAAPFRPAKLPSYLPNTNIHNSKSLTPIVKQKSNIITSIIIPSIKTPAVALTSTLTSSTLSYVSTKKISLPARPSTFKSSPSINHSPPSMNSILSSNSAPKSDSIKAKPNPSEPKLNNKEVKNSVKGGYIDSTQTEPGDNGLSDSLVGLIIACTAGTLILTLTLVLLLLCYKRHRYGNSQQEMKNENLKKPVKRSHHHHHHHHQSDQYSKKSSPRSAAAPFSELASHRLQEQIKAERNASRSRSQCMQEHTNLDTELKEPTNHKRSSSKKKIAEPIVTIYSPPSDPNSIYRKNDEEKDIGYPASGHPARSPSQRRLEDELNANRNTMAFKKPISDIDELSFTINTKDNDSISPYRANSSKNYNKGHIEDNTSQINELINHAYPQQSHKKFNEITTSFKAGSISHENSQYQSYLRGQKASQSQKYTEPSSLSHHSSNIVNQTGSNPPPPAPPLMPAPTLNPPTAKNMISRIDGMKENTEESNSSSTFFPPPPLPPIFGLGGTSQQSEEAPKAVSPSIYTTGSIKRNDDNVHIYY